MSEDAGTVGGPAGIIGLQTLKRYWWLCVTAVAISMALAVIYLGIASPVYEAEVRVVIQQLGLGLDGTTGKKTYDREFLSTQAELIRSPLVVSNALESVPPLQPPPPDADPVAAALKDLRVSPLANTDIIRVTYQNADADQAMRRLRAILDSYQAHLRKAEQTSAGESFALLKKREKELRDRLHTLQQQLTEVRASVPAAGPGTDVIDDERALLRELTSRWAAVRAENAWLTAVTDDPADSTLLLSDNTGSSSANPLFREVSDMQARLTTARAEFEEASLIYGSRHPERAARAGRVAVLNEQLAGLRSQLAADLHQRRRKLAVEERALQLLVEQERQRLQEFDAALLEDERLLAETARVSELHRTTLASLEAVGMADRAIADGRASISVRVIDDYVAPQEPVWPQPVPLLGASAMLGLLLSLGCIVLLEANWPLFEKQPANDSIAAPRQQLHSAGTTDDDESAADEDSLETRCAQELSELQEIVRDHSTSGDRHPAAEPTGAEA